MLSSISWSQFLTAIAYFLVFYYIVLAGLYYRIEVLGLFKPKTIRQNAFSQGNVISDRSIAIGNMSGEVGKEDTDTNGKVHELMQEIKDLLATAAKAKTIKEELLMALQMLLRGYPDLKELPIISEINQHIVAECKNICSITLSDAEMKMLWNG
jgi:hypothetical protein